MLRDSVPAAETQSGVETEDEVNQDSDEKHDGQNGGTQPVVVRTRATIADGTCTPVIRQQCVYHDRHSYIERQGEFQKWKARLSATELGGPGEEVEYSPTNENMAAEMRPILSPKLSKPAARAESVTVKLSHDKTIVGKKGVDSKRRSLISHPSKHLSCPQRDPPS